MQRARDQDEEFSRSYRNAAFESPVSYPGVFIEDVDRDKEGDLCLPSLVPWEGIVHRWSVRVVVTRNSSTGCLLG